MNLTFNAQVILLLYANFGLSPTIEPKPLNIQEYNSLVIWLRGNSLTPKDLFNSSTITKLSQDDELSQFLGIQRILALLNRGVTLSLAIKRWTNQCLWVLTRDNSAYPVLLKRKLRYDAPPIIYGVGNQELLHLEKNITTTATAKIKQLMIPIHQQTDPTYILSMIQKNGAIVGLLTSNLAKTALKKTYRIAIEQRKLTLISFCDPNSNYSANNFSEVNYYINALCNNTFCVK